MYAPIYKVVTTVCTALSQRCDKVVTGTCMMTSDKIKVTTCGSNCLERGRAKIPLSKELRLMYSKNIAARAPTV